MTVTLLFLALLMGAVVWWLLKQSINVQPWVAHAHAQDVHGGVFPRHPATTALVVFLAVATSLFALFISAYAMRIRFFDWSPLPQPQLLTVNTAILIMASIVMEWTSFAARRGDIPAVRRGLLAAGLLSFGFVAGQLVVWRQLSDAGFPIATSAATAFFYLLTAVHGLHVLGGLVAWSRTLLRAWSNASADRLKLGVRLCAIYWHFLLVVWLVLLAVLVSNDIGLAICNSTVSL
jgi:cytochrome c oxidase subunit III